MGFLNFSENFVVLLLNLYIKETMSASTVSITANTSTAARRRAVEKKPVDLTDARNFSTAAVAASPASENGILTLGEANATAARDAVVQVRKPLPDTAVQPRRASNTARKHGSKPEKPRWKTVLSILVKNILLFTVVIGWIFMVKEMFKGKLKPDPNVVPPFEGNVPKMEEFVTSMAKTMKMMQVQVDVIDRKIGEEIAAVKDEINEKIESKNAELGSKLTELDGRTLTLEKFAGELGGGMEKWLSKEEFSEFLEDFSKAKGREALNLDEVRVFAKGVVEKEIEKHAADGLGRVDYALALGGGMVVKHSEPLVVGRRGWSGLKWLTNQPSGRVSSEAEKMLKPSFGEPGQCFPLKGSSGFVQIRLRTAIIPTAVTLEHVAESVAYDRSSAPKRCRVFGWLQGQQLTDLAGENQEKVLLTEFTYDLQERNIQTFDVVDSSRSRTVDTVRFEFTSNHGSATHTCLYRLRVHGDEPNSVSMLTSDA